MPVSADRLVVVVGTGTEVGKTWVACRALEALRAAGVRVAARKPVQSYDPGGPHHRRRRAGRGHRRGRRTPCARRTAGTRWPMAPPMAAEALGRPPFTLSDLVDEITWPDGVEVGVVESAGGVRSPMASDDADGVALAAALMPDVVVLVADAGLGTINSIRPAAAALDALVETRDALDLVVVLNRFDPLRRAARAEPGLARGPRRPHHRDLGRRTDRRADRRISLRLTPAARSRPPGTEMPVALAKSAVTRPSRFLLRSSIVANVARLDRFREALLPAKSAQLEARGPKDIRYQRSCIRQRMGQGSPDQPNTAEGFAGARRQSTTAGVSPAGCRPALPGNLAPSMITQERSPS